MKVVFHEWPTLPTYLTISAADPVYRHCGQIGSLYLACEVLSPQFYQTFYELDGIDQMAIRKQVQAVIDEHLALRHVIERLTS